MADPGICARDFVTGVMLRNNEAENGDGTTLSHWAYVRNVERTLVEMYIALATGKRHMKDTYARRELREHETIGFV